jgi:sporulation protein YlmC with PRC-barrel domain
MERANHGRDNPYTQLEGYKVHDASGEEVGEIEDTVYDAPSDVL